MKDRIMLIVTQVGDSKKDRKKKTNLGNLLSVIKYVFEYSLHIVEENCMLHVKNISTQIPHKAIMVALSIWRYPIETKGWHTAEIN